MADQVKKAIINSMRVLTRGVVVNSTGKPATPVPNFTSSSGKQVNPAAASKQASESASGQADGNTPEKK